MNSTIPALTANQAARIERARTVLAEPQTYEPADMAGRIGRLEFHIEELLALVGNLSGRTRVTRGRSARACRFQDLE